MSPLPSLRDGYRAVVYGASGGIGAAFVEVLASDPRCGALYTGSRGAPVSTGKLHGFQFDLLDETSIAHAASEIAHPGDTLDLVIVATGVLHSDALRPEKSMRALEADALARSFALNAIGPALIAKHMLPLLARDRKSVFAALSARVGSISDNRSGGWHAYRASKAALNQLIRTCAIELSTKSRSAVCVTLHPGTVDTAMSKPFQAGVATERLFSPATSAGHLLRIIDQLTAADTGGFYAWDGQAIGF